MMVYLYLYLYVKAIYKYYMSIDCIDAYVECP